MSDSIICSSCVTPCTGEVLKVGDKHFHINCFKCVECGTLLASGGYFPCSDQYYCSKDYHRLFGTKCKSCGDFVEGRVITALGNSYHPKCFCCDRCSGEIHSGTVVTYNDKEEILCQNCSPDITLSDSSPTDIKSPSPTRYNSTPDKEHSPVTSSTSNKNNSSAVANDHTSSKPSPQTSKSRSVERPPAQERASSNASSSFDDVFDFSKVPDINAETHPYMGKCAQCKESIRSAQSLIALNRHWHLFCFACARCARYLTNEYMDNGDQAYCEPCFQELYGLICETCQDYITGTVLEAADRHYHPTCAMCTKCGCSFNEGDDVCISGEEVWHLDCIKAKKASPPRKAQSDASPTRKRPASENSNMKMSTTDDYKRVSNHSPSPGRTESKTSPSSRSRQTPDTLQHPPATYPIKDLQLVGRVLLPKDVNRTKLEQHLTDEDFFSTFHMDRNSFYNKPQWKQIELKKKANLF